MMSLIKKQLAMSRLPLPNDLVENIKTFAFRPVGKIASDDPRYELLQKIPEKDYDPSDGVAFVYLCVENEKWLYLTVCPTAIQLQTFETVDDVEWWVDGVSIPFV
jgi:hypothetical protein